MRDERAVGEVDKSAMKGGRRKGGRWLPATAALFWLLLWGVAPATAGVVLRFEIRELEGGGKVLQRGTTRIQGKWLRMDVDGDEGEDPASSIVFDGERRVLFRVDHREETVIELSLDQLKAMMREVSARLEKARTELEQQLPNLPPEERRRAERILERRSHSKEAGEGDESGLTARRTERSELVDGKDCVVVELVRARQVVREACVVEWERVGLEPAAFAVFGELGAFFDEMMTGAAEGGLASLEGNPFLAFGTLDGFPLVVRTVEPEGERRETTLSLTEVRPFDPDELQPPASYRRTGAAASP